MINKFKIILVEPQMGENIGSAARAMLNGLNELNLIKPRDAWLILKQRHGSLEDNSLVETDIWMNQQHTSYYFYYQEKEILINQF